MRIVKQLSIFSIILLLIVLAASTIIEKFIGTVNINHHVYETWWFALLWCVIGICGTIYIFVQKQLFKNNAAFILHCAFIITLIGAGVSFVTSERGIVHMREGKPNDELPFRITLEKFEVQYDSQNSVTPKDYRSTLLIDNNKYNVSLNKIVKHNGYRLYQTSYDSDLRGSTLMYNFDPYGTTITYLGYYLMFAVMLILLFNRRGTAKITNIIILALTAVAMMVIWLLMNRNMNLQPILRSGWFPVHVSLVSASYLLFAYMAISAAVALVCRKKSMNIYITNRKLIYPALFLLIAGIFVGAIWANVSWGRYWGWDPKEVWALITMFVYGFAVHFRLFPRLNSHRFFNAYVLIAFVSILITYFGVNLLGGMHSYT